MSVKANTSTKESSWNLSNGEIPTLQEMYEGDTSVYKIKTERIADEVYKASGTYHRTPDDSGYGVEMDAMCYGTGSEFILDAFARSGVMSCVQLAYNPVLRSGPPEEKIKNKIYQYLDIVDIILWNETKQSVKSEDTNAGFIFKSNYNGLIVIVCFGSEITVTTTCGSNKEERTISNDYYFGNFGYNNDTLVKTGGNVLKKINDGLYDINEDQNIVTIIHPKQNCKYEFMIADGRGVKDMTYTLSKTIIGESVPIVAIQKKMENMQTVLHEIELIHKKRSQKGDGDGCVDTCVFVLSKDEEVSLSKRFENNIGQPITIYGTDGVNTDTANTNTVASRVVKNKLDGTVNLYNTFGIPDEVMKRIGLLQDGQIVIFITTETKMLQYFMKVRSAAGGRPLFIELTSGSASESGSANVKLSFPEIRKTYKLGVGDISLQKMERCNYKILAKPDEIKKIQSDYQTLRDQYNDIIVGRVKVEDVNPFNLKDIKDAISPPDTIAKLKMQLLGVNLQPSEDDVNELREELSDVDNTPAQTLNEKDKEELKSALNAKNFVKVMLLLVASGVAMHLAGQYFLGMGLGELSKSFSEWLYPLNKAVDSVSQTAANIIIGNQNTIANASSEQLKAMVRDAAEAVSKARPDIALQTMKNHVNVIDSIKMVWTKIGELMLSGTPEGVTYIGASATGQELTGVGASALSGPLNAAQTDLLDKLQSVAGGLGVTAKSVFQFTDGDKVIKFTAGEIMAGSFDQLGNAVYSKVPGAMQSVIYGFGDAMTCVENLVTTNMGATSEVCKESIEKAFTTQQQQFVGLGSAMWGTISGLSLLQITSIAVGVAAVSAFAGWLPVGWLVNLFAAKTAASISTSGIGINELINVYRTAVEIGSPYVETLKEQIMSNPTATAEQFARTMGWY